MLHKLLIQNISKCTGIFSLYKKEWISFTEDTYDSHPAFRNNVNSSEEIYLGFEVFMAKSTCDARNSKLDTVEIGKNNLAL